MSKAPKDGSESPPEISDKTGRELVLMRERMLSDSDSVLYLNVGHYLTWYAACEMALTMLLYWAVNNHPNDAKFNADMFDALTKGMDVKVKVVRLKAALTIRKAVLPEALKQRLSHLQEKEASVRNFVVHSYLAWDTKDDRLDAFRSHNFVRPQRRLGQPDNFKPKAVFSIGGYELFLRALWLKGFAMDLGDIAMEAAQSGEKALRLEKYRSWVPRRGLQNPPPKAVPTKDHKRGQTRRAETKARAEKKPSKRASRKKQSDG